MTDFSETFHDNFCFLTAPYVRNMGCMYIPMPRDSNFRDLRKTRNGQTSWLSLESILVSKESLWQPSCCNWPNNISNMSLWNLTNVEPLIAQRKYVHIIRKNTEQDTNTSTRRMALKWTPQGSRSHSRSRDTWRLSILQALVQCNHTWEDVKITAVNRIKWKCFEEAISFEKGQYHGWYYQQVFYYWASV